MARILYGVAGEGSGHSSRAKEVIGHLISNGHIVKVVSYDRGYKNLRPYFDVEEIFGLRFVYRKNEVQPMETIFRNLMHLPGAVKSINKVRRITDEFKPNIIFSDFEPVSAIIANSKKLPLISVDNQHRLINAKIEYPKKYKKDALAAQVVTKLMVMNAKAYLAIDFTGSKVIDKKTFLFPPILRKEVLDMKTSEENYILVYFTSSFGNLLPVFKKINKKFIVYGFDKNKKEGNIIFKKASQNEFLKDLAGCQGIVANAGFTLMTEALYLRKPYLAVPVKGQFEQVFNAYYLEKLGYGKYWDELNKEKIESFLFNLDLYKKNLRKYKKYDNSQIFRKIDELIKKYTC